MKNSKNIDFLRQNGENSEKTMKNRKKKTTLLKKTQYQKSKTYKSCLNV